MKKVLITGASRGIGLAMAEVFHHAGYKVYANYRTMTDGLEALAAQGVHPVRADVTVPAEVAAMVAEVGAILYLINNAGIALVKPFANTARAEWDAVLASNLTAAYTCTQAFLPPMLKHHNGCVINVSSIWGEVGASCEVAYSAAKAGLLGLTKALAKELGPSGIRVNAILPGVIDTDMNGTLTAEELQDLRDRTPLGGIGRSEQVARAALYLCESEFVTGEALHVDGGFGR